MIRPRPLRAVLSLLVLACGAKLATIAPLPPATADPLRAAVAAILPSASAAEGATDVAATEPNDGGLDATSGDGCRAPSDILEAIAQERAMLAIERAETESERALVAEAKAEVREDATRLAALRDEIESQLERVEAARSADVDRLVGLYRGMKPKQAAAIVSSLDMSVVMELFGAMPARDAAPILALLDPTMAGAVSRILLERGRLPEDRDLEGLRLR